MTARFATPRPVRGLIPGVLAATAAVRRRNASGSRWRVVFVTVILVTFRCALLLKLAKLIELLVLLPFFLAARSGASPTRPVRLLGVEAALARFNNDPEPLDGSRKAADERRI